MSRRVWWLAASLEGVVAVIESEARVVACEEESGAAADGAPGFVWVEAASQSACGSCSVKGGCGVASLDRLFGRRVNRVRAWNDLGAKVGERVLLGLDEGAMLRSLLWVYAWPLVMALVTATAVEAWLAEPLGTVLAAVLGFVAAAWLGRAAVRRLEADPAMRPRLLKRLSLPGL